MVVAAVGILGGGVLVARGMTGGEQGTSALPLAGVFQQTTPSPSASPSPTGPSPEELAAQARAKRVKALDAALKKYAKTVPEFSVAVLDRETGETYAFRGDEKYETASVVKVQVLACLLLTAQDNDRKVTSSEDALAKKMIRYSDNAATTSLFSKLGRASAIGACNKRLGLTQTKVSSSWGLTRTTVKDQVKLLDALVDDDGELNASSRKYADTLMSTVSADQDWGIPAVAAAGEEATVKNGWLSRSTEGGLWIINTVGRVTGDDVNVSVAVLSHANKTMSGGIKVVEKAAKLTRTNLKY
ncbi:beta-lactamase class A [Actinoplanes lutulentus]|uniref:Beta-lactamase class A n=2 Tax=Actinoplanes lutulentus TaxID=1287878 RepID=A0A327ZCY1_9ACTN|nr:serine hydrolase [Actinoplanes lutulentus]RAK38246.1 beta-lactamase class A [Actinoplanes lutulentus]